MVLWLSGSKARVLELGSDCKAAHYHLWAEEDFGACAQNEKKPLVVAYASLSLIQK